MKDPEMSTDKTIEFLKEIEQFKTCERTCRTTGPDRAESDAEHTWHLAFFLMLFEDKLEGFDFNKLLKIALIHDLPEIYAGDTNPYRDNTDTKDEDERVAANKLFSGLPEDLRGNMLGLFKEYQDQDTAEAKIVKSADKLLPLIQNLCTNNSYSSYRKLNVMYDEVKSYMDPYFVHDNFLKDLYQKLLSEAQSKGVFSNPGANELNE